MNNNLNNYTQSSSEETQSIQNQTSQQAKDVSFASFNIQSDFRYHNNVAKLISEESSILDEEEDENIKQRRVFEMNLNKKRNQIRKEFHKQEDFRQSHEKTSQLTSNENRFKEVLNEWIKKNYEKQKDLDRDNELLNKIKQKDTTLNSTQSNFKFKKLHSINQSTKQKNEFSSIFPVASNMSQGQEYFPLKNEKNPEELNSKIQALKEESVQSEHAQDAEVQRQKSLKQNYNNLVKHLDQRKKEIREEEDIIDEMTKKQNSFQQNQLEILKNLFATKKNVQQLKEVVDNIEEKQNNVLSQRITTQNQEQKEIKQEENKLSTILLKIDQAEQLHRQTIQELIEVQKEEEYRKNKKNESYKLIFSLKDMKYLDDLCLKNKIDEYIDNSMLESYTTKNRQAINFDVFELEYPLINFRRSHPSIEKSKLQDVIDDFYREYPQGPYKLSESLIEKYKSYIQKFESLKRYYQDTCVQVQQKSGELALLTTEVNEYIDAEKNSKPFEVKDKYVVQLLENFEDLKPSIDIFKENKKVSREYKKQISFSLALFMKILDNTLRLTNIITLLSTNLYLEVPLGLTQKSDEVQTIVNEQFSKKNIKILRKQRTKYSTRLESLDVNNARLSRLSIISPLKNQNQQLQQQQQVQQHLSRSNSQARIKTHEQSYDKSYEFKSYYTDDNQMKIVPNDFDSLFVEFITNNFIPTELKEKWGKQIVNDPLIYGFCNYKDIQNQIQKITNQQTNEDVQNNNLDIYEILLQTITNELRKVSMEQLRSILQQILHLKGQIISDLILSFNQQADHIKQHLPEWDMKKFKQKKISQANQNKLIKDIQIKVSTKIDQTLVNPVDSPQAKIRIEDQNQGGNKKKNNQFKVEDFIEFLKKDKNQSKKQLHEVDEKFKNEELIKRRKSSTLFKQNYEKYYLKKESDHYDQVTQSIKKKYEDIEEKQEEEKHREEIKFFLIEKEKKDLARQKIINHYQESSKSGRYGAQIKDLLENSHAMAFITRQELSRKKQDLSRTQISLKKQDFLLDRQYEDSINSKTRLNTYQIEKSENKQDTNMKDEQFTRNKHSKSFSQDIKQPSVKYQRNGKAEESHLNEKSQSSSTQLPRLPNSSHQGNQNQSESNLAEIERQKKIQKIENAYKRVQRAKSINQLPSNQNGYTERSQNQEMNNSKLPPKKAENKQNDQDTGQQAVKISKLTQSYGNIRTSKLNIPALKIIELIKEKQGQNNLTQKQEPKSDKLKEESLENQNTLIKNKTSREPFYKHLFEIREDNSNCSKLIDSLENQQEQNQKLEKININKKFADIYKQKIIVKAPITQGKQTRSISNTTQ
ncbi:hypothetical protein ABPG72_022296 [Tetrahymena utriculariae]